MNDQYQAQRALNDDQFTVLSTILKGQKWTKRHPGYTAIEKLNDWSHGYEPLKKPIDVGDDYAIVARCV